MCCGSNAPMETSALQVNGVVNNALFQSSPHINQTLRQIIHILHFCMVDSLLNYAPEFVVNWIEVRAVTAATNLEVYSVTTIS